MHRNDSSTTSASGSSRRARLVIPLFLLGLVIAGAGVALKRASVKVETVSQVHERIVATVMQRAYIGPFFVHAEEYDAERREFRGFHAETDHLLVAARRATIDINPATDTISFVLHDVSIVQIPERGGEAVLFSQEQFLLGPLPYRADIIPDPGSAESKE